MIVMLHRSMTIIRAAVQQVLKAGVASMCRSYSMFFRVFFEARTMSDLAESKNNQPPAGREADIESLARETDTPIGKVEEIYSAEHSKLEQSARIKTFVPVLVHRRVKAILQVQRGYRA